MKLYPAYRVDVDGPVVESRASVVASATWQSVPVRKISPIGLGCLIPGDFGYFLRFVAFLVVCGIGGLWGSLSSLSMNVRFVRSVVVDLELSVPWCSGLVWPVSPL